MKSLESNGEKIEQLKKQINNGTISTTSDKKKIKKEIGALQAENEGLEKRLEEIKDEQYLVQLTNKILEKEISKIYKGISFSDFLGSLSITTAGGVVGGAVGYLAGPQYGAMGAAIGAGMGGTAVVIKDACNQQ